jgi:hypothetical protein
MVFGDLAAAEIYTYLIKRADNLMTAFATGIDTLTASPRRTF